MRSLATRARRPAVRLVLAVDLVVCLAWGRPWPLIPVLAAMAAPWLSAPRGERAACRRRGAATLSVLAGAARSLSAPILTGATIVCGALCVVRVGLVGPGAVYPAEQSISHVHDRADAWLSLSAAEFSAMIAALVLVSAVVNAELVARFRRGQTVVGFAQTALFVLASVVIYGPIGPVPHAGRDYRLTLAEIRHAERLTATAQSVTGLIQALPHHAQQQVALGFERLGTDAGRKRGAIDATAAALVGRIDRSPADPPVPSIAPNVAPAKARAAATGAERAKRQALEALVLVIEHLTSGAAKISNPDLQVAVEAVLGELADRGFDAVETRTFLTSELSPAVVDAVASTSEKPVAEKPVADGPGHNGAALAGARGFARGGPGPADATGAILKNRTDSAGRTDPGDK